jgi:hypothetical protein
MIKPLRPILLTIVLVASACGSSKSTSSGKAGAGGGGATGTAGGGAGATGTAGGGAGATGTAGNDSGAGTTGTAGNDAATSGDVASSADGGTTNIKAATGGTVTAAGLVLEIPPGALAVDTDITVGISDGAALPSAASLVASVYDLGPNGTTFLKPVKLTINVDAAKLGTKQAVVSYLAAGNWVALSDSVAAAGGKVGATTTHFTSFGVVGTDAAACLAMPKQACGACCQTTFAKGLNAPLDLAIKACGCKAGSPCETQCAGNVCASLAPSAECQTCLHTFGSATPASACITQSQLDCINDVDCKSYSTCVTSCGSTPVDASVSDSSTDTGPACTVAFTDTAPLYSITKVAEAFPTPVGGTIVPGTYWVTQELDYTGVNGATGTTAGTYSETAELTATEWDILATVSGMQIAFKSTYTVAGTTFTALKVCGGNSNSSAFSYSVIGNEIHFLDMGGGMSARVLVRQP